MNTVNKKEKALCGRGGERYFMANQYICTDIYTVRAGDTLYSVSQHYNVDVGLLMRINRVRNPYNLRIGTRLCIPGPAEPSVRPVPLPEVLPDEMEDNPAPPENCRMMHIVEAGDTLYMIAKKYHITLDALMNANPAIDPYNMQVGTDICIPQ